MTYYAITAQVITHNGDYSGSRQVPLFYLHPDVQGIVSTEQAETIAKSIINPLGLIADSDIKIYSAQIYQD